MIRKQIFAGVLLAILFTFAIACGSSSSDDGTTNPTPTPSGTGTVENPTGEASFAIYNPSTTTILLLGQTFRVRWNAINYDSTVVIKVGLDNNTDSSNVLSWFPVSYGNGTNYIDWDTTSVDLGTYYFVFRFELDGEFTYKYSHSVTVEADSPFTVPPTVQMLAPVSATSVYPETQIEVSFKVGNADNTAVTMMGVDDDNIYTNGVLQWYPTEYYGPGAFDSVWDTTGYANDVYYIVIKASNGTLSTYCYSQKITIADNISYGEAPVAQFTQPSEATLLTTGQEVSLRYSVTDSDSVATAMLILDTDEDYTNGWERVIYTDLPEGVHTYDWNTLGVEPDVYFFAVIVTDGNNQVVKYSEPIIVNPVSAFTEPPVVTIASPSKSVTAPIGAPLSITGTVTDPDSEAIVKIGIDSDSNFSNGVTVWLDSTFTGTFDVSWITSYYEAGYYYIIVLASDGINDVYKYTSVIELLYLMPSGWTTNGLRTLSIYEVFDGLDSVGAYRSIHNQTGSTNGMYESTNKTGGWATTQLANQANVRGLIGEFDDENVLHVFYQYGNTFSTRTYHTSADDIQSVAMCPAGFTTAVPLALVAQEDMQDHCLTATLSGTSLRLYYGQRSGSSATYERIANFDSVVSGYSNFWGWMFFEENGTGHIFVRLSSDDGSTVSYPVYYLSGSGSNWTDPALIANLDADTYGIEAFFYNNQAHCYIQASDQIYHVSCHTSNIYTETIFEDSGDGTGLTIDWAQFKMVGTVPNIIYGMSGAVENLELISQQWVAHTVGTIQTTSETAWLVTDAGDQYFFANSASGYTIYERTALGWYIEVITSEFAYMPSVAYSEGGGIVTAYKTSSTSEQRLNFARKVESTGEWNIEKLNNDVGDSLPIAIYANEADNIYIRYITTDLVLTVLTFR